MTLEIKHPIAFAAVYLWLGFVCAISFMEAWLKFRAPGVTLPIGLSIGRLVFGALNKIEWICVLVIFSDLLISKEFFFLNNNIAYYIPVILLFIQTMWLLPALDARAEIHIQGGIVEPSNLHFYYVGIEALKVLSLFVFSLKLFK